MGNGVQKGSDDVGGRIGGLSGRMRSESALYKLGELTRGQRDAVHAAKKLFEDLANADAGPDLPHDSSRGRRFVPSFLPTFDPHRDNHAVLIDGRRGTGKTAALLRVLQDLDEWATKTPPRVIPVSLIDLHPIPETTNLIVHIVGELRRVMHPHVARGGDARDHSAKRLFPRATRPDPGRAEELWERFAACAVAGWDPHLSTRVAMTDVETYVEELKTAERQRRDLRACFREFIDQVVEDFRAMYLPADDRPPFFVFALDDADMIPQRGPELLELVRMLWHPRVGFLLTGDSDLFRFQLCQNFAHRLRLKDGASAPAEVYARAEQLAFDVYNKEIPPTYRLALGDVSPDEALRETESLKLQRLLDQVWARPEGQHAGDDGEAAKPDSAKLQSAGGTSMPPDASGASDTGAHRDVPGPVPQPSMPPDASGASNTAGTLPPLRFSNITVGSILDECGFTRAALPVTLRSLVDFQLFANLTVEQYRQGGDGSAAAWGNETKRRHALGVLLRSIWDEVSARPEADSIFSRGQIAAMYKFNADDGGIDLRLPTQQPLLPLLPTSTPRPSEAQSKRDGRASLYARRVHYLGASGQSRGSAGKDVFTASLERGVTAAIALTACLASLSEVNHWSSPPSNLLGVEPFSVYTDLELVPSPSLPSGRLSLGWPMIPRASLLDLSVFAMFWNLSLTRGDLPSIVESKESAERRARRASGYPIWVDEKDAERLAMIYLTCLITTASADVPVDTFLAHGALSWESLARSVVTLARNPNSSDSTLVGGIAWASYRAALLAAPEGGLPAAVARKWLMALRSAFQEVAPATDWVQGARYGRRLALYQALIDRSGTRHTIRGDADDLSPSDLESNPVLDRVCDAIDDHYGRPDGELHPWIELVEGRTGLRRSNAKSTTPRLISETAGHRLIDLLRDVRGLRNLERLKEVVVALPAGFEAVVDDLESRRLPELEHDRVLELLWTAARRESGAPLPDLDGVAIRVVAFEQPLDDDEGHLRLKRASLDVLPIHAMSFGVRDDASFPGWLEELFQWIDDQRPYARSWKAANLSAPRPLVSCQHPTLVDPVPWPRLSIRSFAELERLRVIWRRVMTGLHLAVDEIHMRGGSATVSLAHRFIRAQYAARAGTVDPSIELDLITDERHFGRLTRALALDAEKQIARQDDRADCIQWLRDLTLLSAPEYGLPARFANALLTESLRGVVAAEHDVLVARLRELRRDALDETNAVHANTLAAAIDNAESSANFDWFRRIEVAASRTEQP